MVWSDCRRQKFLESGWDGQRWWASRLLFLALCWAEVSADLLGPPRPRPPNTESSVGSACTEIRVCLVAFWCQEGIRTPACSHQFTAFQPLYSICYDDVREFFVFPDQCNLQFYSLTLCNKRSADFQISVLFLVVLAFSDLFVHDFDQTFFENIFLLKLMRVQINTKHVEWILCIH